MASTVYTDYHMHSTFSADGHDTPAQLCRHALALGLTEIAITDHVEWEPAGQGWQPDFARYFDALAVCREEFASQGLTVYSGVELGNPHTHLAEAEALLGAYPFDVVIGSLHWLDGRNIHDPHIFVDRDPYAIYERYFDELGKLAAAAPYDMVAHFDRIFWPGTQVHGPLDAARLESAARRALAPIAAHGCVLELNTRFLAHAPGWNDVLLAVLRWFREAGGVHVAVDSDGHRCRDIGRHREIGMELVQAAGFARPVQWAERSAAPAVERIGAKRYASEHAF